MPCDKVAVVSAKLNVNSKLLLGNQQVSTAIQKMLAPLFEMRQARVSNVGSGMTIYIGDWTFNLNANGILTGSYNGYNRMSPAQVTAMTARVQGVLNSLAGVLTREKVAQTLKSKYKVTEETRQGSQIRLEIEL
jgi:hypothetical protein